MEQDLVKYLTFAVETERYGIKIEKVKEIIMHENITALRDAKDFLKGVINLRNLIIPIIDMKLKFGLPYKEYNDRTVFIIVELTANNQTQSIGLAVDSVYEVIPVNENDVQQPPKIGLNKKTDYLEGIIHLDDTMIMLLNIDKILSSDDIIHLTKEVDGVEV